MPHVDLTQEVFARVSEALPGFRGDSKLSTWVYRIATNAAYDRLRSRAARPAPPALLQILKAPEGPPPGIEQELARQEMSEIRLHRARARLKAAFDSGCSLYRDEENELACEPRPGGVSSGG